MLALASPARAASAEIETPHISTEILVRAETVAPGDTVDIAVRQSVAKDWHTYWRNPGDSGAPTEITWTLPEGAAAGPIRWPVPHRLPYPPLVNYGYSDTETLLTSVTVPSDWQVGKPFATTIEVDWLVCADICIPESGSAELTIPTGAETLPASSVAFAFLNAERALPKPVDWPAHFETTEDGGSLVVAPEGIDLASVSEAYFFPAEWGVIDHSSPQDVSVRDGRLVLSLTPDAKFAETAPSGVLTVATQDHVHAGYALGPVEGTPTKIASAAVDKSPSPPSGGGTPTAELGTSPGNNAAATAGSPGLVQAILFAFIGGLILNLMPCVFPVLALKAVAFVGHGHETMSRRVTQGAAYTAGILASFLALAGGLIAIKAGGAAVGWGFQLQQPIVVAVLAYVLFLVGLNLSGLFEVGVGLTRAGQAVHGTSGATGSFLTGVLAAVVATPCTAPFMAVAIGYALTQGTGVTLAVFAALGIGLALPFLIISLVPAIGRRLPKPGAWMIRLRQVLAFPVYATAAWLIWVLAQQAGVDAMFAALVGCVLLAFAGWLYGLLQHGLKGGRVVAMAFSVLGLVAAVGLLAPTMTPPADAASADAAAAREDGAQVYSAERLASLRSDGAPVFVNVTAAWCITCKVNERVALGRPFRETLERDGVTYLHADWTRRDPEITALLERFGRAGVPLYLVYPKGDGAPRVLPQILTERIVIDALDAAAGAQS
ncbi:hypothetical protein HNS03_17270 [Amorphus sp. 3PC139-8]